MIAGFVGFLVGLFIGLCTGVVIMCFMAVASDADDRMEGMK